MGTFTDDKNQFVTKLLEIISEIRKNLGCGKTQALEILGKKIGYSGKQIRNWIKKGDVPPKLGGIMIQLDSIAESFRPITPATPKPQSATQDAPPGQSLMVSLDTVMPQVVDLAVKHGEMKRDIERLRKCKNIEEIMEILERQRKSNTGGNA